MLDCREHVVELVRRNLEADETKSLLHASSESAMPHLSSASGGELPPSINRWDISDLDAKVIVGMPAGALTS